MLIKKRHVGLVNVLLRNKTIKTLKPDISENVFFFLITPNTLCLFAFDDNYYKRIFIYRINPFKIVIKDIKNTNKKFYSSIGTKQGNEILKKKCFQPPPPLFKKWLQRGGRGWQILLKRENNKKGYLHLRGIIFIYFSNLDIQKFCECVFMSKKEAIPLNFVLLLTTHHKKKCPIRRGVTLFRFEILNT